MRNLRLGLAVALVVIAVLLSGIPLFHAHDTSAAGIHNSWCVLRDLGGQVAAPLLSIPAVVGLEVTLAPPPVVADEILPAVVSEPASPRAPPTG